MDRTPAGRQIRPDHEALSWEGAIEVEHSPDWSHAWRLPRSRIDLFPTEGLQTRAEMAAGVRIVFDTDSTTVSCRADHPCGSGPVPDGRSG